MNNREKTLQVIAEVYEQFNQLDIPAEEVKDQVIDKLANLLVIERNLNAESDYIKRSR